MPKASANYVKWTPEETGLLVHFMKLAVNERGYDQKSAAEFASKKLGRSVNACLSMYHRYQKSPDPEIVVNNAEPAEDVLPGKPLPKVKVYSANGPAEYEVRELDGILLLFIDDLIIRIEQN